MSLNSSIPTLDIQSLKANPLQFGKALGQAWTETGFVAVTNHGISEDTIGKCLLAARGFFSLPSETKQRYHIKNGGGQRGYTPFGIETAKDAETPDLKEFWHVGREFSATQINNNRALANIWPTDNESFKSDCLCFFESMDLLGRQLLKAVAIYLQQSPDFFEPRVAKGNSILRLLHYPPCEAVGSGTRAAAHEDINVITLLVGADQVGLEILRRDGTWIPVQTDSGSIVCNVGDMLERLTNNLLPSTTHRVSRPTGEAAKVSRYSIPYFLHFAPEVVIETLPECITPDNPNRYQSPITAQAFLEQRLADIGLA